MPEAKSFRPQLGAGFKGPAPTSYDDRVARTRADTNRRAPGNEDKANENKSYTDEAEISRRAGGRALDGP